MIKLACARVQAGDASSQAAENHAAASSETLALHPPLSRAAHEVRPARRVVHGTGANSVLLGMDLVVSFDNFASRSEPGPFPGFHVC
jgi:hypothetical protein